MMELTNVCVYFVFSKINSLTVLTEVNDGTSNKKLSFPTFIYVNFDIHVGFPELWGTHPLILAMTMHWQQVVVSLL